MKPVLAKINGLLKALRRAATRDAATAELCVLFEPMVRAQARRYCQRLDQAAELEELEQVARMGLVSACRSFALTGRKCRVPRAMFIEHALWQVRHALAEHIANDPTPVRLPSDLIRRVTKMRKAARRLTQELGREPTAAEIAATGVLPQCYKNPEVQITYMLAYDSQIMPLDDDMPSTLLSPEDALIEKETERELKRQR